MCVPESRGPAGETVAWLVPGAKAMAEWGWEEEPTHLIHRQQGRGAEGTSLWGNPPPAPPCSARET